MGIALRVASILCRTSRTAEIPKMSALHARLPGNVVMPRNEQVGKGHGGFAGQGGGLRQTESSEH